MKKEQRIKEIVNCKVRIKTDDGIYFDMIFEGINQVTAELAAEKKNELLIGYGLPKDTKAFQGDFSADLHFDFDTVTMYQVGD